METKSAFFIFSIEIICFLKEINYETSWLTSKKGTNYNKISFVVKKVRKKTIPNQSLTLMPN